MANAGRIEKEDRIVMAKILLTQGKFAIVDDEKFDWLNQWKWYAHKVKDTYYARRDAWNGKTKKRHNIFMHHFIMNPPAGKETHHINNNGLDNRVCNMKVCSRSQNLAAGDMNRCSNKSSIYRGVGWDKVRNKWWAKITYQGKTINIGRYKRENQAAMAYNIKALKLFGDFACLNWLRLGL